MLSGKAGEIISQVESRNGPSNQSLWDEYSVIHELSKIKLSISSPIRSWLLLARVSLIVCSLTRERSCFRQGAGSCFQRKRRSCSLQIRARSCPKLLDGQLEAMSLKILRWLTVILPGLIKLPYLPQYHFERDKVCRLMRYFRHANHGLSISRRI